MASEYAISKQTLTGIADAIREKTETTATMTPGQMPSKIRSINGGGSGGVQSVEVTQIQSTGTKIASIDVDGTSTDLYAPNGGGGGSTVTITPVLQSGTKIATAIVDGTSTDLYAPAQVDISGKLDAPSTAGTSGQVLKLDSNLDPVWANESGGTVTDVQVNGTSIVNNGVANVPVAGSSTPGVVKVNATNGVYMDNGSIVIYPANVTAAKEGNSHKLPITADVQHAAAFYGLAKAAGDSTQSASSNPVGTYTDAAKAAIQAMLGTGVEVVRLA